MADVQRPSHFYYLQLLLNNLTCIQHNMSITDIIISDKEILNGTPVFKGTRVPVKNLFDYLEAGDSIDQFLEDFDYIPKEATLAVLKFSEHLFSESHLYENIAG